VSAAQEKLNEALIEGQSSEGTEGDGEHPDKWNGARASELEDKGHQHHDGGEPTQEEAYQRGGDQEQPEQGQANRMPDAPKQNERDRLAEFSRRMVLHGVYVTPNIGSRRRISPASREWVVMPLARTSG